MTAPSEERIVAAAIRRQKVTYSIPRPARHHTIIYAMPKVVGFVQPEDQGFLTSEGRFVSRKYGEGLARACGQLTKPLIGGELTSEDLW